MLFSCIDRSVEKEGFKVMYIYCLNIYAYTLLLRLFLIHDVIPQYMNIQCVTKIF